MKFILINRKTVLLLLFAFIIQSCQPCRRNTTVCELTPFAKTQYSRINENHYWIFKEFNLGQLDTLKILKFSKFTNVNHDCLEYEEIDIDFEPGIITLSIDYPYLLDVCDLTTHRIAYYLPDMGIGSGFSFTENGSGQLISESIEFISEIEINGIIYENITLLKSKYLDLYLNEQKFINLFKIKNQTDTLTYILQETNFE